MGWLVVFGEAMKWIKCSEQMPPEHKKILFVVEESDNEVHLGWYLEAAEYSFMEYTCKAAYKSCGVTHWLLAPEKPNEVD